MHEPKTTPEKLKKMAANPTHGRFQDILSDAAPELRTICQELRELICSLHEGRTEVVWPRQRIASFGTGPKKLSQHYAYIGLHGSHVNLGFYRGARLPDPEGLLEGTGQKMRHVKIREIEAARSEAVAALLREAIDERRRAEGI